MNKTAFVMTAAGLIGGAAILITVSMLASIPPSRVATVAPIAPSATPKPAISPLESQTVKNKGRELSKDEKLERFVSVTLWVLGPENQDKYGITTQLAKELFDTRVRATLMYRARDQRLIDILNKRIDVVLGENGYMGSPENIDLIRNSLLGGLLAWYKLGNEPQPD
jgi:hypothetical protein